MPQIHTVGRTATTITHNASDTIVTYHSTQVVRFNKKRIILNTGNWFTATTKNRMNQTASQFCLPYVVFQRKGQWFVEWQGNRIPFTSSIIHLIY